MITLCVFKKCEAIDLYRDLLFRKLPSMILLALSIFLSLCSSEMRSVDFLQGQGPLPWSSFTADPDPLIPLVDTWFTLNFTVYKEMDNITCTFDLSYNDIHLLTVEDRQICTERNKYCPLTVGNHSIRENYYIPD